MTDGKTTIIKLQRPFIIEGRERITFIAKEMAFTEIFENCTDSELQDLYNRDNFFRDNVEQHL